MRRLLTRLRQRVLPNLHHLRRSEVRRCGCCQRLTLVASLSAGEEFRFCVRCRANLRYEMLASYIRANAPLERWSVVELDPRSPLRPLLSQARSYLRTFYDPALPPGSEGMDGARCEDLTKLTLPEASVDLLVSSDVLEHVPDLPAALHETARVLKPGGWHLFTVPTRERTVRRAESRGGEIVHLLPPEYHSDPLNPAGILAYWDIGLTDAAEALATPGLSLEVVAGPRGHDRRVVWRASRV